MVEPASGSFRVPRHHANRLSPIPRAGNHALGDGRRRQLPVPADDAPHHPHQSQPLLHLAESKPSYTVGRAHENGGGGTGCRDRLLRAQKFILYERGTFQREVRVRMRVVADFVAGFSHCEAQFGNALDVETTLENVAETP